MASGAVIGVLATLLFQARYELSQKDQPKDQESKQTGGQGGEEVAGKGVKNTSRVNSFEDDTQPKCPQNLHEAKLKRDRLPSTIILVRHGQSAGNADHTLYRAKPDNLVELTNKGMKQAHKAGKRVEKIFHKMGLKAHEQLQERGEGTSQSTSEAATSHSAGMRRIHLVMSPFERTRQTAAAMRPWFAHRVVRTDVEPRIREQEFGNLQGHDFDDFRREQKRVGRFWYRFPTGESGSDVYDRVKSWWTDSVMNVNERYGYEPVDAIVVVTHGLTMRFVLMQLFGWSPQTFHSVWNADNCDAYVLRKDLSKPGPSPYVLDEEAGDMPKSSIDLKVEFDDGIDCRLYKLNEYLKIPPPRTQQLDLVKAKLEEQYPEIEKERISSVMFLPFIDGAVAEQRTKCGRRASISTLPVGSRKKRLSNVSEDELNQSKRFHHANSAELHGFCPNPELYAKPEESWQY